ncbi:hypothetical protein LCGC14_1384910, partial [marine sediment metagenome]
MNTLSITQTDFLSFCRKLKLIAMTP